MMRPRSFLEKLRFFGKRSDPEQRWRETLEEEIQTRKAPESNWSTIGIIAGNGSFPLRFALEANRHQQRVVAVCHRGETDPLIERVADEVIWIRVGQLGTLIHAFRQRGVTNVAMAGGIQRVRWFGVRLDSRGAALLLRLRSAKDDVLMRGIAEELGRDGIEVVPCTIFLQNAIASKGYLTTSVPSPDELNDIAVGVEALKAMSAQDIGQLVVVKEGVLVAVEAVEGSDAAIRRGGELGGKGTVVVKFAKPTQDMRFDVPTVGLKTLQTMQDVGARVLAIEAERSLIMDKELFFEEANRCGIAVVGCEPLISTKDCNSSQSRIQS